MSDGEELLEIFGQVAYVSLELAVALDEHDYDAALTAADGAVLTAWTDALPEARAAVLLTTAWGSRDYELDAAEDRSGSYATELHGFACEYSGDADGFRLAWGRQDDADLREYLREVKGNEELPLHAEAGALASRLGSDHEELSASLETALMLLAPVRRAAG